MIGVVPLLLGLLFELVVVAPLRVPLDQTPIFFPWQDWALGVLHAKIVTAVTMMGPQWWLKRVIEQVYNDGIRNINLRFILTKLCAPVIGVLGMSLSVPYVVARSIVPFLGFPWERLPQTQGKFKRSEASHSLRGGEMSKHRGVLGRGERHSNCNHNGSRGHMYTGLQVLFGENSQKPPSSRSLGTS